MLYGISLADKFNFAYVINVFGICVNAIQPVIILKLTYLNEPSLLRNSHGSSLGKNNVFIGIVPGVKNMFVPVSIKIKFP
jgi:hypothetical protein